MQNMIAFKQLARVLLLVQTLCVGISATAGVLPEDRGDLMYHSYDGGNVTVNGPSLLVRKKIGEQFSVAANYYIDMVTSASIDVQVLGASEYKEERKQGSLSADYLRGKTTYSLSYISSVESDYQAKTANIGVSEDMFGDLTTISLGYTRAWDKVFKNLKTNGVLANDPGYGINGSLPADHRMYRIGLSQIITKNMIMGLNYESQSHEGQLGNPYRAVRYLTATGAEAFTEETLPGTRTTNAMAVDARYYLPYRAVIRGSYRFFSDTWGIVAHTAELQYIQPWKDWTFEGSVRFHKQDAADFYSDLFPRANYQNFEARDRNLSTMNDQTIHVGVSYNVAKLESWDWTKGWIEKGAVNLFVDTIKFNFEDFRDARQSKTEFTSTPTAVGAEPLYAEDALVIRLFFSVWF
jgi:hypothetical protein